jgi:hypothetical protein
LVVENSASQSQVSSSQNKPVPPFKGPWSRDEYKLKAYEIESVFYVHAPLVFKFLGCLVEEINKYKDFACVFETPY